MLLLQRLSRFHRLRHQRFRRNRSGKAQKDLILELLRRLQNELLDGSWLSHQGELDWPMGAGRLAWYALSIDDRLV